MDFKTNTSFNIANTSSHEDFDDDYILIYKDIFLFGIFMYI